MFIKERSHSEILVGRLDLMLTTVYKSHKKGTLKTKKTYPCNFSFYLYCRQKTNTPNSVER